jgi:hypothetical protein
MSLDSKQAFSAECGQNAFPALFPSATRFGSILVSAFSLVPLRLADLRTENLAPNIAD